jgi:hypothetical protein
MACAQVHSAMVRLRRLISGPCQSAIVRISCRLQELESERAKHRVMADLHLMVVIMLGRWSGRS